MNVTQDAEASIWKVDRFATHDGPGIRTNLYFKGCPLRCLWCSNPEGQAEGRQMAFSEHRCTGCGRCFDVCPAGALRPVKGRARLDRARCTSCLACLPVCSPGALHIYEKSYSLPQVLNLTKRDRHIYRRTGGGITCTGGEPLAQPGSLMPLLRSCRNQGIHTAVETSGYADPLVFGQALELIDWLFVDLKHLDGPRHRRLTGRDNSVIRDNLILASSTFARAQKVLAIRMVLVPGMNDGDNLRALGKLVGELPRVDFVELLPYHEYGQPKYADLGRRYPLRNLEPPSDEDMRRYQEIVAGYGVECRIGQA